MSRIHDVLAAPATFASRAHRAYWSLLNAARGHKVVPFSARYWWTRERLVTEICEKTLAEPASWEELIRDRRFGHYDERVVEYSWALARIATDRVQGRLLDVGCVMNTSYCLRKLTAKFEDIHLLNLVSEPLALHGRISYHCEDIRASALAPSSFDAVTCISTIEHVGGDNGYNSSPNGTPELPPEKGGMAAWEPAFGTLLRLIKPRGLLLVTMPFGSGKWVNGFYEFGPADVSRLHIAAGEVGRQLRTRVFGKDALGWRYVSAGDAPLAEGFPQSASGSGAVLLVETT